MAKLDKSKIALRDRQKYDSFADVMPPKSVKKPKVKERQAAKKEIRQALKKD